MSAARKTTASKKKAETGRQGSPGESEPVSSPTPVTTTRTSTPSPVESSAPASQKKSNRKQAAPETGNAAAPPAERSAPAPEESSNREQAAPGPDSAGPSPAEEDKRPGPLAKIDRAGLWQKIRRIKIPRPPSWLTGLLRHRPSGLEIMVVVLIVLAAIMVGLQLFGSRPRLHPTPAVLSRSDSRKVPPGVVLVLNTLERNAQVDRRTLSRLEAMLNGLRIQFHSLRKTVQSRQSAPSPAAGSPGTTAPSVAPAPPALPPVASPSSAAPDRRLIDLEIRLDELTRKVQALERRLGRTRRPR
jgi:hypothetical protein